MPNTITMPGLRVRQLRQALDEWNEANEAWNEVNSTRIEKMLALAVELKAARDECEGDDSAFGRWLLATGCDDLGKNDRLALIRMGENIELSRQVLEATNRHSPRYIWDNEIRPRLAPVDVSEPASTEIPFPTQGMVSPVDVSEPEGRAEVRTISPVPRTVTVEVRTPPPLQRTLPPRPLPSRSPYRELDRGAEVYRAITHRNTRYHLAQVTLDEDGGPWIWALVLSAIDNGFLTTTDIHTRRITTRLLFPDAPEEWANRWDLTSPPALRYVQETLMPAAIACRDAILANPRQIAAITNDYIAAQVSERAVQALPPGEVEIVVFGERLWPPAPQDTYDYDQVRAAVWTFRDLNTWLETSIVGREVPFRALTIRMHTKWYGEYVIRSLRSEDRYRMLKVYGLIDHCSQLLEANPEGECKWPPFPAAEGQW